jgi:hypothetical protein
VNINIDIQTIKDHIQNNLRNPACTICGGLDWEFTDTLYEMREFKGGGMVIGSNVNMLVFIALICRGCLHTELFNALAIAIAIEKSKEGKILVPPSVKPPPLKGVH